MYVYIYIYVCVCVHIYIYIYMRVFEPVWKIHHAPPKPRSRHRKRKKQREKVSKSHLTSPYATVHVGQCPSASRHPPHFAPAQSCNGCPPSGSPLSYNTYNKTLTRESQCARNAVNSSNNEVHNKPVLAYERGER